MLDPMKTARVGHLYDSMAAQVIATAAARTYAITVDAAGDVLLISPECDDYGRAVVGPEFAGFCGKGTSQAALALRLQNAHLNVIKLELTAS